MKREELKSWMAQFDQGIYDIKEYEVYDKSEADSVMDAMEARIKELENKNRNLQYTSDMWMACCKLMSEGKRNVMSSDAIAEMQRIKNLETENERLHIANLDNLAHFNTLKEDYEELKKQVPVWHKLDKPLYVDENGNDVWDLPVEDEADENGEVYAVYKCGVRGTEPWDEIDPETIAMWCELPTEPSTTEESSATEKENG